MTNKDSYLNRIANLGVPPEVIAAIRNSDVDWSDPVAVEERIALVLEGCGLDPALGVR